MHPRALRATNFQTGRGSGTPSAPGRSRQRGRDGNEPTAAPPSTHRARRHGEPPPRGHIGCTWENTCRPAATTATPPPDRHATKPLPRDPAVLGADPGGAGRLPAGRILCPPRQEAAMAIRVSNEGSSTVNWRAARGGPPGPLASCFILPQSRRFAVRQPAEARHPLRFQAGKGSPRHRQPGLHHQIPTTRQIGPMAARQSPQAAANAIPQRSGSEPPGCGHAQAGDPSRIGLGRRDPRPKGAAAAAAPAIGGAKLGRVVHAPGGRKCLPMRARGRAWHGFSLPPRGLPPHGHGSDGPGSGQVGRDHYTAIRPEPKGGWARQTISPGNPG